MKETKPKKVTVEKISGPIFEDDGKPFDRGAVFRPKIVAMEPRELVPYLDNAKKHPEHQIAEIMNQIKMFGFDVPITIDRNNVIIKGHGRREAAIRLKLKLVPVIVRSDLTAEEARTQRLGDNKVAESPWDDEYLKKEMLAIRESGLDLTATGFSLDETEAILGEKPATKKAKEAVAQTQFIVAITCSDEAEMAEVYKEMKGRGFECKLIT